MTDSPRPRPRPARLSPAEPAPPTRTPSTRLPSTRLPAADTGRRLSGLPGHLPRPTRSATARREVRIRPWIAADAVRCTTISCTYTTSHVWQMDARQDSEEIRVGFRLVRLPRELTLDAEQRPPASPTGATRRGQLWLVAEEVEVPPGEGARPTAVGPGWSHAVRPSRGASAVQLGFPASSPGPLPSTAASSKSAPPMEGSPRGRRSDAPAAAPPPVPEGTPQARGTIVGYVAAYRRTGDPYAYLQSLAVDTAYRRRGIGTRLVSEVCRWAAEEGAGRLMADIGARNYPAMRLLQKAGFSFCGYNDRCYPKDEVAVFLSVGLR